MYSEIDSFRAPVHTTHSSQYYQEEIESSYAVTHAHTTACSAVDYGPVCLNSVNQSSKSFTVSKFLPFSKTFTTTISLSHAYSSCSHLLQHSYPPTHMQSKYGSVITFSNVPLFSSFDIYNKVCKARRPL